MDRNLENIINRVANRNSLTQSKTKTMVESFFKNAKQLLQRDDMPTVLMHGLGRITPDESKVKRRLIINKKAFDLGKITKEEFEENNERLLGVLKTLIENRHTRNN